MQKINYLDPKIWRSEGLGVGGCGVYHILLVCVDT